MRDRMVLFIFLLGSTLGGCADEVSRSSQHFSFHFPADMDPAYLDHAVRSAERAYAGISAYLKIDDRPYITVMTHRSGSRATFNDQARDFAITLRESGIRDWRAPYAHEITHILTRTGGTFLAEGLAEFMEEKFEPWVNSPVALRSLHQLAAEFPEGKEPLRNFFGVRISNLPRTMYGKRMKAYVYAGSFVKFLAEEVFGNDGERLREFIMFPDFAKYTGRGLDELDRAWWKTVQGSLPEIEAVYGWERKPRLVRTAK